MCPNLKSPQKHQFPQLQTRLSFDQTLPQFITRWSLHQREGEGTRTGTLSLICVDLSCCLDTLSQDWTRYTTCLTTRSCSVQPNLPLLGRLHLDCPSTPSPLFFDQVYFNVSMLYDIANCMLNYWPNTPLQRHRIILIEDVHNFKLKIWHYVICILGMHSKVKSLLVWSLQIVNLRIFFFGNRCGERCFWGG